MIKGAIFDFDGTLFDSVYVWKDLGKNYLIGRGIEPEEALGEVIDEMSMAESAEYFRSRYGISDSVEMIIDDLNGMMRRAYEREIRPKWSAFKLTEWLYFSGAKLCIVTSADRKLVEAALFNYGMLRFFMMIMTCEDVGAGKHRPDIYLEAHKLLRTPMEETVVFEDAFFAAKTAKDAGFTLVGVKDENEPRQKELKRISDVYLDMKLQDPYAIIGKLQKKCYIVGAGENRGIEIRKGPFDTVIAADGGLKYLEDKGIKPDSVIGDFDSYGGKPPKKAILLPPVKDITDMSAAVKLGADKGYREFHIFCGTGGRFDHTFANIQLLAKMAEQGMRGFLYDGDRVMTAVKNGAIRFKKRSKGVVSVFSLTDSSSGVWEKGLKYTLSDATLRSSEPMGVSNEFIGERAEISVKEGCLLVICPVDTILEEKKYLSKKKDEK